MNNRWSASRLGCYKQCLVNYKNNYISELVSIGGKSADLQQKGLDFHEIAEWMESNKDYEDLVFYAQSKLKAAAYDTEKYPVIKTMPRFWQFWQKQVIAREALGFVYSKEGWQNFEVGHVKQFVGALDLLLKNPSTGEIYIFDYKSGGSAKMTDDYARQLMIYAIAIGQKMNYDLKTIPEKIHLALFYPMANLKDEEQTDPLVAEKQMMKSLKFLTYSEDDLEKTIKDINEIFDESEKTDWAKITGMDATMGFYCSWCQYMGSIKAQSEHKEFVPCELSYKAGLRSLRGVKFVTKAESKKLESVQEQKA